jgi:3-phenylpropionate/trans-cinnamate dioxygenase ferredoxin reductase subunit
VIVVVGGSAAGLSCVETLRREGYDGNVLVVGAEAHPPYDRPPLSKQVLVGALSASGDPAQLALRAPERIAELGADWMLGTRAVALDVASRSVKLDDGSSVSFDGLLVCTGVRPRSLPLRGVPNVHTLRSIEDAAALALTLRSVSSLVVIGAGFLGCEVAAAARQLGIRVDLIDTQPYPLIGVLGAAVGERLARLHTARGVQLHLGTLVTGAATSATGAARLNLANGEELDADAVLVAVGSTPNIEWLVDSGLNLSDGVVCDEYSCAAPGIYAAGDVASWRHPRYGRLRVEHKMNAIEHGGLAARNLLGARQVFQPIPYSWSDQYDAKIQLHGVARPASTMRVIAGDITSDRFAAVYSEAGEVSACLMWNMPRLGVRLRSAVASRISPDDPGLMGLV